ncbi:MAG: hypothetical protein AAF264_04945 [Pseudomonadota bacterium]
MDRYQGVGFGLASVALIRSTRRRPSLGQEIRSKGKPFAAIANRWFEGDQLVRDGRAMTGWLASESSRSEGRALIDEGRALKARAQAEYAARKAMLDMESI